MNVQKKKPTHDMHKVDQAKSALHLFSSLAVLLATGLIRNLFRKERRKRPNMAVGPTHVEAQ